jgi:hypothetical protein
MCRARRVAVVQSTRPGHSGYTPRSHAPPDPFVFDAGGVSEPRPTLSPAREQRSRRRSYLWFQTHGLHLKKIDGLGLQVIENSGGQATAEHQHGVKVDAIGLDVRHHCANGVWPCTTYFSCGALCFKNKSRIHILSASFCSFRRMPAAESSASELRRKGGSEPLRPDVDSALSPCALASIRALRRPF